MLKVRLLSDIGFFFSSCWNTLVTVLSTKERKLSMKPVLYGLESMAVTADEDVEEVEEVGEEPTVVGVVTAGAPALLVVLLLVVVYGEMFVRI